MGGDYVSVSGARISVLSLSYAVLFADRRRTTTVYSMDPVLRFAIAPEALAAICRRRGVHRLALFGSVLRDDFGPDSDIDVLVEFEPGRTPGYFGLFEFEDELSVLFGGRKVDLRTPQELSQYFRDEVVNGSRSLYVAA
jgi:predicted nucleotidyltransferase